MLESAQSPAEVSFAAIQEAAERIRPYLRRTPLVACQGEREFCDATRRLKLKLECMQVTGSFKPRGAVNRLKLLPEEQILRGLIAASGGNHGLGVAYAGWLARVPVTIYAPLTTPQAKIEKLARWGAMVMVEGEAWDDSNRIARSVAERDGLAYFHAFADPAIIAGQGTIALEILEQASDIDVLIVAIGGGGMISGISVAARALKPSIRIVGVEPVGAPTLSRSLEAGRPARLERIDTAAVMLAALATEQINFELVRRNVDQVVLVSDDEMRMAARWLWFEHGIAAELSGAATVAAVLSGRCPIAPGENACAVICGSGHDGIESLPPA